MKPGSRLRGYLDVGLVLGCEAALVAFFWESAPFLGSVDFAHFGHWLTSTSPSRALSALVRLLGFGVSCWLVLSTCIYAAGALSGHQRVVRRWRGMTLPVVRRVVDALALVTVTASALGTSAGAAFASQSQRVALVQPFRRLDLTEPSRAAKTLVDRPLAGQLAGRLAKAATVPRTTSTGLGQSWEARRDGGANVSAVALGRHFPHPGRLPHLPPLRAPLRAGTVAVPSLENGFAGLPKGTKVVVVEPGDCLSVIAEKYLGDWRLDTEIEALNYGRLQPDGLALLNDHWIYPGWVLVMPDNAVGTLVVGETAPAHAGAGEGEPAGQDGHEGEGREDALGQSVLAAGQGNRPSQGRAATGQAEGPQEADGPAGGGGGKSAKQPACAPPRPEARGGRSAVDKAVPPAGQVPVAPAGLDAGRGAPSKAVAQGHVGPAEHDRRSPGRAAAGPLQAGERGRSDKGSAEEGRPVSPEGGRGSPASAAGSLPRAEREAAPGGGYVKEPGNLVAPTRRGHGVAGEGLAEGGPGALSAEGRVTTRDLGRTGAGDTTHGPSHHEPRGAHRDLEILALSGIGAVAAAGVVWRLQRSRREMAHARLKGWVPLRNRPQVEAAERRARVVASEEAVRWVDLGARYLGALVEQAAHEARALDLAGPLASPGGVGGKQPAGEGRAGQGPASGGTDADKEGRAGQGPAAEGSGGQGPASGGTAADKEGPGGQGRAGRGPDEEGVGPTGRGALALPPWDGPGTAMSGTGGGLDQGPGHAGPTEGLGADELAFERWWKGEPGTSPAALGADVDGATVGLSAQVPSLVLARVGECGLEVVLSPAPPGRFGWFSPSPAGGHALDVDVGLDDLETLAEGRWSPWPALVSVGEAEGSTVLLNLEHAGVLSVEGPTERVRGLLAGLVLQLASQPWADEMLGGLYVVGDSPLAGHLASRVQHVAPAEVMELAEKLDGIATARQQLAGPQSLSVARAVACEALPHVAVVFGEAPAGALRCLVEAAVPERSGVALVAEGPVEGAEWRLVLDQGRGATLEGPVDRREVPIQLTGAFDVEEVALLSEAVDGRGSEELVEAASVPSSNGNGPSGHVSVAVEGPERGAVEVRLLGPVDVAGGDMDALDSGRIMATLGLLAYLAAHPRPVTAEELASSLWPLDASKDNFGGPQRKTVMNVISRARAVLGYGANGKERLVLTPQGYRLTGEVTSDWARFEKHVSMSRGLRGEAAARHLREALELVRGEPFGGAMASQFFEWVASEHLDMTMAAKIVDISQELAELALDAGDYGTVYWAVDKGLLLEPTREELFRLWMHALGRSGRPAKVDDVYRRLKLVLRQRIHPLEEPQPESREVWKTYTAAHSVAGRPTDM